MERVYWVREVTVPCCKIELKCSYVGLDAHMGMGQVTCFLSSGCTYTKDMDTKRLTNLKSIQVFITDEWRRVITSGLHNESVFC